MGDQWANLCLLGPPMISREQRTPLSEWWWTVDRLLLAAIIALMLGGIILSLAASPPVATRIGLDPFHFFNRHVLFLLPSFIVLIGVSFLSPRQIRRAALIVFAVSIVLIVATLLVGPEVKGSRRWITLIGLNIQASESAKPAFVVIAAWLFAESARRPEMPATSMALVLLMMLVSLLVMEPDFGQTMLTLMVWGALFFIAGMRMIWVLGLAGAASAGLFGAYLLVPHVAGRIKRFMNPGSGDTFHVDTAMNMSVNLQLIPAKGMTLPFISYGGSSIISLAYGVGMMLALTRQRPRTEMQSVGEANAVRRYA